MGNAASHDEFIKLVNQAGKNVNQVAKDTGIPPTTLYEWGYGRSVPKLDKLMKLANYFNVPLEIFLSSE